ncbi:lysylphosphatidylglycerol synthase transmembrane domain-containing protein [Methanosarcina horonobensis]|uniref:lysylphosphatidylglycerol synthase transmembrane domain-containing protein n=1 Tax=Methanosarcina horonobensis TaxID=418008 RepID=UPI000AE92697|nr:lysylphosphatidylglycerol synthase transmembrane domain-containing protein [Methanosarcina horonobensis]
MRQFRTESLRRCIIEPGYLEKKATAGLLILTVIFLVRTHWTEIVPLLEESWKILSETRIIYVILAFSVYLLSVYFFAVRWQQVLSSIGYNLRAKSLFPILFGSIFVNNLTPANRTGGETLRILWVKKQFGVSYTNAFITILFERVVEIVPITLLLIYVLYAFPSLKGKLLPLTNHPMPNSIFLLLLVFAITGTVIWYLKEKFAPLLKEIQQNWKQLNKSFTSVLLLSCSVWILDIIRLKLIALALNLPLSMYIITAVSILYLFLGLLPVTPGGLGIVEGGLISLLLFFGLPFTSAGSFVFLERFISYGLSSLIGFLYLFYYGGFKIWEDTKLH